MLHTSLRRATVATVGTQAPHITDLDEYRKRRVPDGAMWIVAQSVSAAVGSVDERDVVLQTSWLSVSYAERLVDAGFRRREDGHFEARVKPSEVRKALAAFTEVMVRGMGGR